MSTDQIFNKDKFTDQATLFFNALFSPGLEKGYGEIEVRIFTAPYGKSYFYDSIDKAVRKACELCLNNTDVYFGVNPRIGKKGTKQNIQYLLAFHAELDYGESGHKKASHYKTKDDVLEAIKGFELHPSAVIHSGGGVHCYWFIDQPVKVSDIGTVQLESINKGLCKALNGDVGTQDISRVLRVPGSYNYKLPGNPRLVEIVALSDKRYSYNDFTKYIDHTDTAKKTIRVSAPADGNSTAHCNEADYKSVDELRVSDKIESLILHGNDGSYPSRSEADMAVVIALLNKGASEHFIMNIFAEFAIGEKYREHGSPDQYLRYTIEAAKTMSDLTEEERLNPLFISGALTKNGSQTKLDIVIYQEYITKKYKIKKVDDVFYKYNGACYEICKESDLNSICQKELNGYRRLFTKTEFGNFLHYATGYAREDEKTAYLDQVKYLTLQNGLYNLEKNSLIDHTPDIFTTNLLLYNYDPDAQCARFLQYLDEIFRGDAETINFVQESVGYAMHKSIPLPAMFFLVGSGSNGKSVFTDVLTDLFGDHNTCSINLAALSDEYYLNELCDKMVNVSSETPHRKKIESNIIKAVTAGDLITARSPHKSPVKFRPFAKHFLAMNDNPVIDDTSHGMWRRIYIIEFPRKFSKKDMDVHLRDKLKKELPGIFNWALEGYKKLRRKDFKLEETHSMEQLKEQYKTDSDSVLSFASENLKPASDSSYRVKFKDVYEAYKKYCETEGHKSFERKPEFKKILRRNGYIIEPSTKDANLLCILNVELLGTDSDNGTV